MSVGRTDVGVSIVSDIEVTIMTVTLDVEGTERNFSDRYKIL